MGSLTTRLAKPWQLVGFGFLQAWVQLIALSPASFTNNSLFLDGSLVASLLLSGTLFFCVFCFVLIDIFRNIYRSGRLLIAACVLSGIGSLLMLSGPSGPVAAMLGIAMATAGSAFLGLWWGKRWTELDTDRTALSLASSSILACVLCLVLHRVPASVSTWLIALLPLASGCLLLADARSFPRRPSNAEGGIFPSLWKVAVMLISIPVAYSLIRSYFTKSDLTVLGTQNDLPLLAFGLCSLVSLLVVLKSNRHQSIVALYRCVITVLAAGFVSLLALPEEFRWIALGSVMVGYSLFDELTWLMKPQISIALWGRTFVIFGWTRLVFRAAAFSGVALGGWLLHQTWFAESANLVACMLMTVLTVMLFMNALTARDFSLFVRPMKVEGEVALPVPEASIDEKCKVLADEFGLSRRELDVLQLLARGRSLAVVEEQLYISNSTARTHTRNIYRKLDIHTKQELIDLVEKASAPQS